MSTGEFSGSELLEAYPMPATLVDANGIIIAVNQAFLDYACSRGYPVLREDRLGRHVFEFATEGTERQRFVRAIESVLSRGEAQTYRWESTRVYQGRRIYVDIQVHPVRAADGRIKGAVVLRQDITEKTLQDRQWLVLSRVREQVWKMRGSEDIDQVLHTVSEGLQELEVPFLFCGVNLVRPRGNVHRVRVYTLTRDGDWEAKEYQGEVNSVIVRLWEGQEVVYRKDLEREDVFGERRWFGVAKPLGIRSVVDVPFSHGTLAVNSRRPDAFSVQDIAVLQDVAQVLSEGFQRLEDLENRERRSREAEALTRAIAVVAGSFELDEVLEALVHAAVELSGAERGFLLLYDEKEQRLVPRAHAGFDWEVLRTVRLEPGEGPSGQAFASSRPCLVQGMEDPSLQNFRPETARLFALACAQPLQGAIALPLRLRERCIGALALESGERSYCANDVEVLERLGDQASLAIDRAQRTLALSQQYRELDVLYHQNQEHVEALRQANERLRREMESRRQTEVQLRQAQKMEAVGQLTAGVAHHFNNLLQGIMGNVELALMEAPDALKPLLEEAGEAGRRGAQIVRQLMAFAHADTPRAHAPVELLPILRRCLDICTRAFDRRIEIDSVLPAALPGVRGHASQLEQVVLNLLLNARDAVEERRLPGRIRLLADCQERGDLVYVRLRVVDDGVGMDPTTRQRIFEPFFTTKDVGKGTGLGLATAYAIVQDHGGLIECESEVGKGSCFSVFLPSGRRPESSP